MSKQGHGKDLDVVGKDLSGHFAARVAGNTTEKGKEREKKRIDIKRRLNRKMDTWGKY